MGEVKLMNIIKTDIQGVLIIEPKVFGDARGWFCETYSKEKFSKMGIDVEFVQDNHSFSTTKGVLRGLHFQNNPKAQSKLVRCTKGSILDVVVDIRKGSPTYSKWVAIELNSENKKQLFIPKGFAHGFLTLTDDVEIQYKVDEYYSPEHDRSIRFDDPAIGIDWGVSNPLLSDKDLNAPFLKDSDCNFGIKVLVTGVKGQLGYDVIKRLERLNIDCTGVDIDDFDLTDAEATKGYIIACKPDVIVHCAAYTAVDKAEDERERCMEINADGTFNLVAVCKELDIKFVYISTDYVFNGKGEEPYEVDTNTSPVNYYGLTKWLGEWITTTRLEKYFIIRTSWAFGKNGNNFVKTIFRLGKERDSLSVVNDQIGSPTYTSDLAELICSMLQTEKYGTYHATNEGCCSWYEFACEIFRQAGMDVKVKPVSSEEYPTKAVRPHNSRLSKKSLDEAGFLRLPDWKDALSRYLKELLQ